MIAITISSKLSGTFRNAQAAAKKFGKKVFAVDSLNASIGERLLCLYALRLIEEEKTAEEIVRKLEEAKKRINLIAVLDTLKYLKKGGRITPAAAAIGTMLRLKPVLQIQGDKLDAFAKARTATQGKNIMINAVRNDMETRFGGSPDPGKHWLSMAYTCDREAGETFQAEVQELFPGFDIHMDPLSLSVACHIGPGALAVTCSRKLEV